MSGAQDSSDPTGVLLKEYCPPLDSAIVLAISLDYDNLDDARVILDSLKAETIVDEADGGENVYSDWGPNIFSDEETNTTQTSNSKSGNSDNAADGESDEVRELLMMFPTMSKFTLKHSLEKSGNDVDRAIDELLNRSFLDDEGEGGKGIDAFSEDSIFPTKRKGKKKGKNMAHMGSIWEEIDAASPSGNATPSKWEHMQSEISYLSMKLNVPLAATTSAYHKHGSLSTTLVALIETFGEGSVIPEDAAHIETISSITSKYPRLLVTHVTGLVKLCRDDVATAYKFADILNRRQLNKIAIKNSSVGDGPLSPLSMTSLISGVTDGWEVAKSKKSLSPTSPTFPLSPVSPTSPRMSYRTAALAANGHAVARHEAYNKASAAYRRSKSDHLMGAVATYYAEEGKTHSNRMKALSDIAAEALVNQNSTEYTLDLHGVTVQQAIKITNERVTAWWVKTNSTDDRAITPFHIITGIGSHSKGGESRLGPAVTKALAKGNWKIEVNHGHVTVLGVQKQVGRKR